MGSSRSALGVAPVHRELAKESTLRNRAYELAHYQLLGFINREQSCSFSNPAERGSAEVDVVDSARNAPYNHRLAGP